MRRRVVLVLLSAITLASGSSADAQQPDTPYAATRLIGRWRSIMNTTLEESRAFAPEEVTDLMEEFVSPGAVRSVQDKANEEQLKKADAIVERFAFAVVRAGARQSDGSVVIAAEAIASAERMVCPVYPFCAK